MNSIFGDLVEVDEKKHAKVLKRAEQILKEKEKQTVLRPEGTVAEDFDAVYTETELAGVLSKGQEMIRLFCDQINERSASILEVETLMKEVLTRTGSVYNDLSWAQLNATEGSAEGLRAQMDTLSDAEGILEFVRSELERCNSLLKSVLPEETKQ